MPIELRKPSGERCVWARLMSPLGMYPEQSFGHHDAAYHFATDATLTIVRAAPHPIQANCYSEVEWAYSEEICFLAAIALARADGEPPVTPYPLPEAFPVNLSDEVSLEDRTLQSEIKAAVLAQLSQRMSRPQADRARSPILPPSLSGTEYIGSGSGFIFQHYEALVRGMDPSNALLVRGLSTWLRSAMLASHYWFIEEAITTLFISMEASFRLVLRRLQAEGISNPTAVDAAAFVGKVFNEDPLERYFSGYYDSRVMSMHPESRFGVFPFAPLAVDDYYHLHGSLRALYAYLVAGYVELWH